MPRDMSPHELTDDELFLLQKARSHDRGYGLRFEEGAFHDRIGPLRSADQDLAARLVADGFLRLVGDEARADDRALMALRSRLASITEPVEPSADADMASLRAAVELHRPMTSDRFGRPTEDPEAVKYRRCGTCQASVGPEGCRTWQVAHPRH